MPEALTTTGATTAADLDIGEVARRSGIAPSALRYYERRGLIEPVGRNGLRRTYAPEVLDRLVAKVAEVGRIAAMEVAREHLGHALECEHEQVLDCPTFRAGVRRMLPDPLPDPLPGA